MGTCGRKRIFWVWSNLPFLFLVGCGPSGCQKEKTGGDPFAIGMGTVIEHGDPAALLKDRPKLKLKVGLSSGKKEYSRGERIGVTCELTVPEGGAMPEGIRAEILDSKKRVCGGQDLRPRSVAGDGRYLFEGSVGTDLSSPGNNTIRILTLESAMRPQVGDDPGDFSSRITTEDVMVRIR